MKNKLIREIDQYISGEVIQDRQSQSSVWKARNALKEKRRVFQKKLFGEHYNYSKIGLNKEKKYVLEEQRNTQIERSNRILLEKIQRIALRSGHKQSLNKRIFTQQGQPPMFSQGLSARSRNNQSSSKSVHHFTTKLNQSLNKNIRTNPKILFVGTLEVDEKKIPIKTFIEDNIFVLEAVFGKRKQRINTSIEAYRIFFKEHLETEHSNIVQFLHYNGQLLQIKGIEKQTFSIQEEQELLLPPIALKNEKKEMDLNSKSSKEGIRSSQLDF